MNPSIAVQLMIGREELYAFGEEGVLARLSEAENLLGFGMLFLATSSPSSELTRRLVDRCHTRGASVALWTMVLADTGRAVFNPSMDSQGRPGYGRLGAWSKLGIGEETFLFSCPTACAEDPEIQTRISMTLASSGADAIFLDRIRHPSPANGLEFLGACGCPRCRAIFRRETGEEWPDLVDLAVKHASHGAEGAAEFLAKAGSALDFRTSTITRAAATYAKAARQAGARVGLDLFSPSIAPLVGQDYTQLGRMADFVKAMIYCKAQAPAGIPLELSCLVDGFVDAGTPRPASIAFAAALLQLPDSDIHLARAQGLPAEHAGREYHRGLHALQAAGGQPIPEFFAGFELVDHPAYDTRIGPQDRDAYIEALRGAAIALCWNLMYIPSEHLRAVGKARGTTVPSPGKES
jgi:hypothetical protein